MPSFMLAEIKEQPQAIARTLDAEGAAVARLAEALRAQRPRLIVIAARGTSDNAATFGRYLFECALGVPVSLAAPSVFTLYRSDLDLRGALAIGVSQSGQAQDVTEVIARARALGAVTCAITNHGDSPLAAAAEHVLLAHAGEERSIAATKTYTTQLALLLLLGAALSGDPARRESLAALPEAAQRALAVETPIAEAAGGYAQIGECLVLARGYNYATAQETALKLTETCYIAAEAFSTSDFQHGPIAMVESGTPAMIYVAPGAAYQDCLEMARRLRELGANTIVVSAESEALATATLPLPMEGGLEEALTPVPYVVAGQLLSFYLSRAKGHDPDAPRRLRKVVKTR
jgi:glucosamine--fructose-6-phosphate aminotransferase (isomerizing)